MNPRVVISGCSGGGKSTLLATLGARGFPVFEEPGRAIVKAELARGGDGLPWADAGKFLALCIAHALEQWRAAPRDGLSFFDRSLVDAFNGLQTMGLPAPAGLGGALDEHRYNTRVFMTPPWAEIYTTDAVRRHTFTEAVQEFERLRGFYGRHGYEVVMLPKIAAEVRADVVLAALGR